MRKATRTSLRRHPLTTSADEHDARIYPPSEIAGDPHQIEALNF